MENEITQVEHILVSGLKMARASKIRQCTPNQVIMRSFSKVNLDDCLWIFGFVWATLHPPPLHPLLHPPPHSHFYTHLQGHHLSSSWDPFVCTSCTLEVYLSGKHLLLPHGHHPTKHHPTDKIIINVKINIPNEWKNEWMNERMKFESKMYIIWWGRTLFAFIINWKLKGNTNLLGIFALVAGCLPLSAGVYLGVITIKYSYYYWG